MVRILLSNRLMKIGLLMNPRLSLMALRCKKFIFLQEKKKKVSIKKRRAKYSKRNIT